MQYGEVSTRYCNLHHLYCIDLEHIPTNKFSLVKDINILKS